MDVHSIVETSTSDARGLKAVHSSGFGGHVLHMTSNVSCALLGMWIGTVWTYQHLMPASLRAYIHIKDWGYLLRVRHSMRPVGDVDGLAVDISTADARC
jgi:hypothetical protein